MGRGKRNDGVPKMPQPKDFCHPSWQLHIVGHDEPVWIGATSSGGGAIGEGAAGSNRGRATTDSSTPVMVAC